MTLAQRRALLAFVSGSDSVPFSGLASLSLVIQRNGSNNDAAAMQVGRLSCLIFVLMTNVSVCRAQ